MDMLSDYDNLDEMIGGENVKPIEKELAESIEESSELGDTESSVHQGIEIQGPTYENNAPRQNEARQYMETFTKGFNL